MLQREVESKIKEHSSQLEQKATQMDLEVEKSRINNLIRLENGSTTGDVELIDTRISIDGTIFDTTGNALRTQLKKMGSDVKSVKENSFIFTKIESYISESGWYSESGYYNNNASFFNIPLDVIAINKLKITTDTGDYSIPMVVFFDNNNKVVGYHKGSSTSVYKDYEIDVPMTAVKARIMTKYVTLFQCYKMNMMNVKDIKAKLDTISININSHVFNNDNITSQAIKISNFIKEIYVLDKTYKGQLKLSAIKNGITAKERYIRFYTADINEIPINPILRYEYRTTSNLDNGYQFINISNSIYLIVDWNVLADGETFASLVTDDYLLSEKTYNDLNKPLIMGKLGSLVGSGSETDITSLKTQMGKVNVDMDSIKNNSFGYTQVVDYVVSQGWYGTAGGFNDSADYQHVKLSVTGINKIKVKTDTGAFNIPMCVFFKNDVFFSYYSISNTTVYNNIEVDIPEGVDSVAIMSRWVSLLSISTYSMINIPKIKSDVDKVKKDSISTVFVNDKYDSNTIKISNFIKEIYIADKTYMGKLKLSAIKNGATEKQRFIRFYLADLKQIPTVPELIYEYYINNGNTDKRGYEYINISDKVYLIVDWNVLADGEGYYGLIYDDYILNDKAYDIKNSPAIIKHFRDKSEFNLENGLTNILEFNVDDLYAGEVNSYVYSFERNYNLPLEGVCLSTNIESYEDVTYLEEEEKIKSILPYVYFNAKKVGTFVLFDDDNRVFIYDKEGNKKYISTEV